MCAGKVKIQTAHINDPYFMAVVLVMPAAVYACSYIPLMEEIGEIFCADLSYGG